MGDCSKPRQLEHTSSRMRGLGKPSSSPYFYRILRNRERRFVSTFSWDTARFYSWLCKRTVADCGAEKLDSILPSCLSLRLRVPFVPQPSTRTLIASLRRPSENSKDSLHEFAPAKICQARRQGNAEATRQLRIIVLRLCLIPTPSWVRAAMT